MGEVRVNGEENKQKYYQQNTFARSSLNSNILTLIKIKILLLGKCKMNDFIRIIVAILLPPLGVFLQVGIGKDFWINILLTIFGYIPGLVHAIWIIAKK